MSFTKMLCEALDIPKPDEKLKTVEHGGRCGMCGGEEGPFYRGQDLCSNSNAVFLEVFHGADCPVCVYCASLFKAQNPKTCNTGSKAMCVIDGVGSLPVIARDSAEKFDRPCWTDLVKAARIGAPCVIILSTNTKKRVWPIATSGFIGENTPVTLSDNELNVNATLYIDWTEMLKDLKYVEGLMTAGLAKGMIFSSLLKGMPPEGWTAESIIDAEMKMSDIRAKKHAPFIQLIAQKTKEEI